MWKIEFYDVDEHGEQYDIDELAEYMETEQDARNYKKRVLEFLFTLAAYQAANAHIERVDDVV